MNIDPVYEAKVNLLLRVLPHIAEEEIFALKGGTAINLFVWDMPRLSVDIDLCYTPLDSRNIALQNISAGLGRIKSRLKQAIPEVNVQAMTQKDGTEAKLTVLLPGVDAAEIIIEVNTTLRGEIWPGRVMPVSGVVETTFKKFAAVKIISRQELFGGKICAALDRQHPRDLFDVHYLLHKEGITGDIKTGFLGVLLGSGRPISEMIRPNFLDQKNVFEQRFKGMTLEPFTYEQFEETRERLVKDIHKSLTDNDKQFLVSFKKGKPEWALFPVAHLKEMPAVRWKQQNIQKLIKQNPEKHKESLKALEEQLA